MSDTQLLTSLSKVNLKEIGRRAAQEAEKEIMKTTLQHTHWNRKKAAELLKISYKALLYKIRQYQLDAYDLKEVDENQGSKKSIVRLEEKNE